MKTAPKRCPCDHVGRYVKRKTTRNRADCVELCRFCHRITDAKGGQ